LSIATKDSIYRQRNDFTYFLNDFLDFNILLKLYFAVYLYLNHSSKSQSRIRAMDGESVGVTYIMRYYSR